MTDKERLGTLKKNREWTGATGGKFYTVDSDDYKWLIKQAERVQELEKYYISEKRLKELLNGNEDIGELYQFVEDNQKIEDVISMLIKEMGYLAGALDDYNKGFFELEKQNKRYREALEFYADEETYEPPEVQVGAVTKEGYKILKYKYDPIINTDKGKKARQALGGDDD